MSTSTATMPEDGSAQLFKFARLIPMNSDAITCFTETFVHLVSRNDSYHLQFCVADVDKARRIGQARDKMLASPAQDVRPDPTAFQMLDGFYELSLEGEKLPHLMRGWRVGRGTFKVPNQGVEMLMLRSDDANAVSVLHCRFRLHPRTGVLLIRNMTRDRVVTYQYKGEHRTLEFGEERPLCQQETRIHIGSMQFLMEYTVPINRKGDFVRILRDTLVAEREEQDQGQDLPMVFGFLPGDLSSSVQRDYFLSAHTKGFGAFGWICAALDMRTGDFASVKSLEVRSRAQHNEAVRESSMWQTVSGIPGLLPLQAEWCEHNLPVSQCNRITERVHFASPLGRFDLFNFTNWNGIPWRDQLTMLRQTLEGLNGLHALGIMHRDVSCKNMLVMSLSPPVAVVHDFGKAIKAQSAKEKALGPLPYVAPEVNGGYYTDLIDAWSWAYSVLVAYGYSRDATQKIATQRMAKIQLDLDHLKEHTNPNLAGLTDLLRRMISWSPSDRMSVNEALEHPCWQACSDRYNARRDDSDLYSESDERARKVQRVATDSSVASGKLIAVAAANELLAADGSAQTIPETVPTQLLTRTDEATELSEEA